METSRESNDLNNLWEERKYLDAFDKILPRSDIYLAVRDFHLKAMEECRLVLDSGGGTGNVTVELLKRGKSVYVVDPSAAALEILQKKCVSHVEKLHIYKMSAEKLPFKDEMFNGVTSMWVAHFVDNFQGYLEEHYRVLRQNGVFALTGRTSGKNIELVIDYYENFLRKNNLLESLAPEMEILRKSMLGKLSRIVKHGYTFKEMKKILEEVGFKGVQEFSNPYFGQCYSLTATK